LDVEGAEIRRDWIYDSGRLILVASLDGERSEPLPAFQIVFLKKVLLDGIQG
jgi:hypothetical protein